MKIIVYLNYGGGLSCQTGAPCMDSLLGEQAREPSKVGGLSFPT